MVFDETIIHLVALIILRSVFIWFIYKVLVSLLVDTSLVNVKAEEIFTYFLVYYT